MLTEVIVLQKIEVAHLLSHGDLLHSALVQVELLGNINITVQNRPHTGLSVIELQHLSSNVSSGQVEMYIKTCGTSVPRCYFVLKRTADIHCISFSPTRPSPRLLLSLSLWLPSNV